MLLDGGTDGSTNWRGGARRRVSSGWKAAAMTRSWRTSTGSPWWLARTSTAGPTDSTGAPDEHDVERCVEAGDVEVGLEAVQLAAVAVAPYGRRRPSEAALVRAAVDDLGGEQDHARTCRKRAGRRSVGPRPRRTARWREQVRHGRRSPPGTNRAVDPSGRVGQARLDPTSTPRSHAALNWTRELDLQGRGRRAAPGAPRPSPAPPCGRRPSPAAIGVALLDLVHPDAGHRPPKPRLTLARMSGRGSGWWP